jgi:hypothetical protein
VDPATTTDRDVFDPREIIIREKTILLGGGFAFDEEGFPIFDEAGNPVGVASFITRFTETVSQVPESSTVMLFGSGALGLLIYGWRHFLELVREGLAWCYRKYSSDETLGQFGGARLAKAQWKSFRNSLHDLCRSRSSCQKAPTWRYIVIFIRLAASAMPDLYS